MSVLSVLRYAVLYDHPIIMEQELEKQRVSNLPMATHLGNGDVVF